MDRLKHSDTRYMARAKAAQSYDDGGEVMQKPDWYNPERSAARRKRAEQFKTLQEPMMQQKLEEQQNRLFNGQPEPSEERKVPEGDEYFNVPDWNKSQRVG